MNKRNEEILNYVDSLYIPTGKILEVRNLYELLASRPYRAIDNDDSGKMFPDALVIETKGRGSRETFRGYKIVRVDIGRVREKYAEIVLYDDIGLAIPKRIDKENIKLNIQSR